MSKLIDIDRLEQTLTDTKDYTDTKEVDTSELDKRIQFLMDFLGVNESE